jgi:hypothetical protein
VRQPKKDSEIAIGVTAVDRSFQIGDHFVARNTDHSGVIRGIIFDIDKEYYHVDWAGWGKRLVPISWVESLKPWTLTCRHDWSEFRDR